MIYILTQELLDEVNLYVHKDITQSMLDAKLSIDAMSFIYKSLFNAIDEAQEKLDKDKI